MDTVTRAALAAGLALTLSACAKDAAGPPSGPPPTPNLDSLGPGIVGTTTVDGKPGLVLANGARVQLIDLAQAESLTQLLPAPPSSIAPSAPVSMALPPSVSLRQYQTPVKDQRERGTCFAFASVAAIEAEYKRTWGVTLDLSEEYTNHVSKMMGLYLNRAPTQWENPPGTWSGGSAGWVLRLYSSGNLAIPAEASLTYVNSGDWGNTSQQGDVPLLDDNASQRTMDDFNLNGDYAVYKIPASFARYVFPQQALDSARYRPTQVLYASGDDLKSVAWYKGVLAAGREIAFGFRVTKNSKTVNGVWMPGDTVFDGHVMLMVGYADSLNAFRVKNSWGTGVADSGYYWFSYDWVTTEVVRNDGKNPPYKQQAIFEGAIVMSVAPPNAALPPEQRFLGRWNLDNDGLHGRLDIYHIPGIAGQINGADDYRIGTYFGPDNVARRVNGTIVGNQIDAYIDWGNSGARAVDDLSGLHFTGQIFRDPLGRATYLGGSYLDNRDGHTYGFYGTKGPFLEPTPLVTSTGLTAYLGSWVMLLDGRWGRMRITSVDSSNWSIHGAYVDFDTHDTLAVSGLVSFNRPDNVWSMLVGNTQLAGYLLNQESGVFAGSGQGGFMAYHSNSPPSVQITYPTQNALLDFDLNLLSGTALHANPSDFEDGSSCCAVDWKVNGVPVASGTSAVYAFSDTGSNTVTAVATDLDGRTAQASVTFRLVNNPPTARILKPANGDHFITGITYNNAVEAETWLTGQGKTITYSWSSSDGTDNFPKSGAKPTNVVFGTPGARTLTVVVADNYGLQAQASVNVVVDTQPTAPSIQFLSPLDQDNIQSLSPDTLIWVNIQIAPSSVQGRVISLVWQGDAQNCVEQTATLYWNPQLLPPNGVKEVWGLWNWAPLSGPCFAKGINGYLRLYVTDPNVATQMAQVRLYNPPDPH